MTLDSSYQDVSDLWYTLSLMLISAFTLTLPSIAIYGLAYVTSGSAQGDPRSSSSKIHYESLINLTPLVLIFYIMQRYLLEGYSVQILSYVWLIEVVLGLGVPLGVWYLGYHLERIRLGQWSEYSWTQRLPLIGGALCATCLGALSWTFLPSHYTLALACSLWISVMCTLILIRHVLTRFMRPLGTTARRGLIWAGVISLCLCGVSLSFATQESIRRSLYRHSFVRVLVESIPLQSAWLPQYKTLDQIASAEQRASWYQEFEARFHHDDLDTTPEVTPLPSRAQPQNVIVVILESVRWDLWNQRAISPRFHRWREHGLYVPNAVAQYPATPLAYAALFLSQTPSVVTQSAHWMNDRPLDVLRRVFPNMYLSRPNNRWFDDQAITGFMTDPQHFVEHRSAPQALRGLKSFVKRQLKSKHGERDVNIEVKSDMEGETDSELPRPFFAWVHLYEPHRPWRKHSRFMRPKFDYHELKDASQPSTTSAGKGKSRKRGKKPKLSRHIDKYYSELRYIDHHLGLFMEWFYEQDIAEDTLVWVMADHGQGIGDRIDGKRFVGHHVHVHNQISWVPLYVSGPKIKKGQISYTIPVSQLDLMPTIFDHVDRPLPPKLYAQGQSLYETLKSPQARRLIPTEAFSIRGKELFQMLREGRTADRYISQKVKNQIVNYGKYPPKLGLQVGEYKIIYNRLLDQAHYYDLSRDRQEQKPLRLSQSAQEKLLRNVVRWETLQQWIVQQTQTR